jgi:hypothetical protein
VDTAFFVSGCIFLDHSFVSVPEKMLVGIQKGSKMLGRLKAK